MAENGRRSVSSNRLRGSADAEKYNISEGKLLGIKLKKIEEKWINNDFKVSDKEVAQVLEN